MSIKNFYEDICNVAINYDEAADSVYNQLYGICENYENECDCTEFFNNFIDYSTAEEIARTELETNGLSRLKCFIGNCYLDTDLFRLDGYGNLENVTVDTLETLREDILDAINAQME